MYRNRRFPFMLLMIIASLVMASCTRSASPDAVPTDPPDGVGGGGEGADLAATDTAVAIMQELLFAGQTQTAQAVLSGAGGGEGLATATPTAALVQPTATLDASLPTATPIPVPGQPTQYTVQPGDWLYKIARDKGVTPQELIAANPQINPNAILQPGTVLTIPAAGVPIGGGDSGGQTYVVKPGDNLFRIGLNNGTTYLILAQLNNIAPPYTVFPGQVIKLP